MVLDLMALRRRPTSATLRKEFSKDFGGNQPPVASIGFATRTVDEGVAVVFDGSGSVDSDGDLLTYAWSFGDRATATGVTASHVFDRTGTAPSLLTIFRRIRRTGLTTAIRLKRHGRAADVYAEFVQRRGVYGALRRRIRCRGSRSTAMSRSRLRWRRNRGGEYAEHRVSLR